MPSATELLPICTVASLTGVKAITLRAWERRYGSIRPQRTAKGLLLYPRQHVDLIQLARATVERGVPIGRVCDALEVPEPQRIQAAGTGPWHDYLERLADAVARFDEAAMLGADTPLTGIAMAAQRAGCDAAVISLSTDSAPRLLDTHYRRWWRRSVCRCFSEIRYRNATARPSKQPGRQRLAPMVLPACARQWRHWQGQEGEHVQRHAPGQAAAL